METNVNPYHERAERWHRALSVEAGPLPDPLRVALAKARRVLDVGCGDGCWSIEQAELFRGKEFVGLDHDTSAIARASETAIAAGRRNVFFSATEYAHFDPVICEGESFGYVRAANLSRELLTLDYARLAKTLAHVTSRGGLIAWTEFELPVTTSAALQQLYALVLRALASRGQRFVPPTQTEISLAQARARSGLALALRIHLGITPYLGYWLSSAGLRNVHSVAHALDISAYNHEMHMAFCEQTVIFMQAVQQLVLFQAQVIEEAAYAELMPLVEQELVDLRFCGLIYGVTAYGTKPQ